MESKVRDMKRFGNPKNTQNNEVSQSGVVKGGKSSKRHTAAMFLFYLHKKGVLQKKTQSKNEIRNIYYGEFKPEYSETLRELVGSKLEFPSMSRIICMYLDMKLILRKNVIDSNELHFHLKNVETFLKIYQRKVLLPKPDTTKCCTDVKKSPKIEEFQKPASSTRRPRIYVDQRFALKISDKFGDNLNNVKSQPKLWCKCCRKSFSTTKDNDLHFQEDGHLIRKKYQTSRKEMIAEYHSLQIQVTNYTGFQHVNQYQEYLFPNAKNESEKHTVFEVVGKDSVKGTLNLTLINCSNGQIDLTNIFRMNKGDEIGGIEKQDPRDSFIIVNLTPLKKELPRGASARLQVKFCVSAVGRNDYLIFFKFLKKNQLSYIMQKLCVSVVSEFTVTDDQGECATPTQAVSHSSWRESKPETKSYTVESTKIIRARVPKKKNSNVVELKDYSMPKGLSNVLNNGFKKYKGITPTENALREKLWTMFEKGLNVDNYKEFFSYLLFIEHHQMCVDILKYKMNDESLLKTNTPGLVALNVPGLAEKRPSVLRGDSIMVTVKGASDVEYEGKVQRIEETRVLLKFSPKFMELFIPNMKVNVRFDFSRHPHNLQHRALEMVVKNGLLPLICFPSKYNQQSSTITTAEISWYNRNVEKNERQREAVLNILNGSSKPAPYLLFGPPGTGKTVTIVEAILQVLSKDVNARILIAAPSNAAADVVASRILNHLPPSQLLRLYSPCREWSQVPEALQKSCNYKTTSGSFEIPLMLELLKPRVLAITMVTSGRLVSLGIPRGHFSHIFIDECAQGLEPEALISIAGLMSHSNMTGSTQVVLTGDPLQLGPVLRSPFVKEVGLEKSMLERLMLSEEIYQRDDRTNQYNPKVLTKLIINFRSHPKILDLPNKLFYMGELQPCGDEGMTYSACQWDLLPKKGIPMIFHGVKGREERDKHSPSYFNSSELHLVVYYLREILNSKFQGAKLPEKEIGIISPYRRQVEKIRASLRKNGIGKDVVVASVEEFQGQERRVIIVSTVRSDPEMINLDRKFRLGFLREPKRFNVAVTRAKALLVVVGNPHILQADPCWGQLLKYCIKLGCYTGVPFDPLEEEEEEDEESEGEESEGEGNDKEGDVMQQFQKMSLTANDLSDVQKMIEPPWESHE